MSLVCNNLLYHLAAEYIDTLIYLLMREGDYGRHVEQKEPCKYDS